MEKAFPGNICIQQTSQSVLLTFGADILCCGGCCLHIVAFSNIPGVYPLEASGNPTPTPVVTSKNPHS